MTRNNSEPYISTYLHSKGRQLGIPVAGNFELTARCNFNCHMCYVHQTPEQIAVSGRRELTAREWLSIAQKAKDMGMIFVLLTGGEPLVRKDFFEIYDGMKKMGLMISINSNGSMLSGENLERFLKDPPNRFNISLYGGSNDTYSSLCGLPVYDQVKENIRALRKAGIQVSLNLSITPFNCNDLEQIYADAVELDVNVKASSYMYPPVRINGENYGCGSRLTAEEAAICSLLWDQIRLTPEEFIRRAENMVKCIRSTAEGCPVEAEEGVRCRAGFTSFWMTWDGRMLPCGMMTTPMAEPLQIGFDAAWEQIRTATARIRMPSHCAACAHKDICGVCAAVCYTETGRFDGVPAYMCEKTQKTVHYAKHAWEKGKSR